MSYFMEVLVKIKMWLFIVKENHVALAQCSRKLCYSIVVIVTESSIQPSKQVHKQAFPNAKVLVYESTDKR